MKQDLLATIIGGGLAGSEAAWQAAERGIKVRLYEMRPQVQTGAHGSGNLAEVVCSNSLGSSLPDRASGLLKEELRLLGSKLLECAEKTAVPAGKALAVDRERFSELVTRELENHPNITIIRQEVTELPEGPTIIASGPLTSPKLSQKIAEFTGQDHLFFFDALSPIVSAESIDMNVAFRASRYEMTDQRPETRDQGPSTYDLRPTTYVERGDYINCPFTKDEYENFVSALLQAERIPLKSFEQAINKGVGAYGSPARRLLGGPAGTPSLHKFFEGCLPVEVIAERGVKSLAFGPMRPVGFIDPRTGRRPYALVQLRQDNVAGTLYNLVGFQTNLKYPEQERIFRMIPGLEKVEFVRFGHMHRNTFIASPLLLNSSLQSKTRKDLFFAGQITGVEGYMGNIATGLFAGMNISHYLLKEELMTLPQTTMVGALCHYIVHADAKGFQPMKANFGILPPLDSSQHIPKKERGILYSKRAIEDLKDCRGAIHCARR